MLATLMASSSSVAQRALFSQSCQRHVISSVQFPSSAAFNTSQKNLAVDGRNRRSLLVAMAKKRKDKTESHSFYPKADDITGPFPEAVLLKKKIVKEDGRVEPEFADAEEEKLYEALNLQLESNLNLERMRHYEVVYLIHEDRVDEVDSIVAEVQEFIREKKGRIWRVNNWGVRRLAYKIKKATHANYILMNFELDAKLINDFKNMLDKDERIIRHLVMKCKEAVTEDCPPPPEYHTLMEEGAFDEDDGDKEEDFDEVEDFDEEDDLDGEGDEFDEDEEWDDEMEGEDDFDDEVEDEMEGEDDFDDEMEGEDDFDDDDNIIIVDSDDEGEGYRDAVVSKKARRTLKTGKVATSKANL